MKRLLFILSILVFWWGCSSGDSPVFYRIPANPGSNPRLPLSVAILPGHNGDHYVLLKDEEKNHFTVPYFSFGQQQTFSCPGPGYGGFYLRLMTAQEGQLIIKHHSSAGDFDHSFPLQQGFNEINWQRDFAAKDTLTVTLVNNAVAVFSNPVFFKLVPSQQRELVFLISIDTLAASHMSIYGYKTKTTENLNTFAKDAVVFDRAFANSSWTVSSHMSIFTSQLENVHQVNIQKTYTKKDDDAFGTISSVFFPLTSGIPTLTESLSRYYLTMSYNGGANVGAHYAFYRGFDLYESIKSDMTNPNASTAMFERIQHHIDAFAFPRVFYFLHTYHVHSPYNPHAVFDFDKDVGGLRNIYRPLPEADIRQAISLYDTEITNFDLSFRDFIAFLKARNLYDKATIILLADHGEEFLQAASWVHASDLSTHQIWIPLLIKFPHQQYGGKKISTPVSLIDVLPTLCAYKRIPIPQNIAGTSFLGLVQGTENKHPPVFSSLFQCKPERYFPVQLALIQGNLKLVLTQKYPDDACAFFRYKPPAVSPFRLYNLDIDPFERNNIIGQHRQDKEVRNMIKTLVNKLNEMAQSFAAIKKGPGTAFSLDVEQQLKTLGYL